MPAALPLRRILFVCRQNRVRSATAERLFCKRSDLEVRSAGTSSDAMVRLTPRMLEWADLIVIMDDAQRTAIEEMFPRHPAIPRLVCLQIPDDSPSSSPSLSPSSRKASLLC